MLSINYKTFVTTCPGSLFFLIQRSAWSGENGMVRLRSENSPGEMERQREREAPLVFISTVSLNTGTEEG